MAALSAIPVCVCVPQGREDTFEFLEAVLDHTCRLFPSEVIHIGGDEVRRGEGG